MSTQKRAPSEGIRVLFVDADSMGCQLMASALKRCRDRFEVLGLAGSSQEAIHMMGAHKPHVAVLGVALEDGPRTGLARSARDAGILSPHRRGYVTARSRPGNGSPVISWGCSGGNFSA